MPPEDGTEDDWWQHWNEQMKTLSTLQVGLEIHIS